MQQFMERIPSTALSNTFLDAMDIARKLGIQYIWINSLCIMQDDRNDWEKESSLMSSVYGGSTRKGIACAYPAFYQNPDVLGMPRTECKRDIPRAKFPSFAMVLILPDSPRTLLPKSMWPWIVQHYSRCKLTFNEDKFPAVSGLARVLHLQTNDQYLAGLWRRDIELQLC